MTVSYNSFFDHDKTMLIGSTNTVGADVGKLRVTLHHNRFANVGQRAPRVRFGQVDVYDNYFYATDEDTFGYSWGSACTRRSTPRTTSCCAAPTSRSTRSSSTGAGTAPGGMTEVGTLARVGTGPMSAVSLLAAYNAAPRPGHDRRPAGCRPCGRHRRPGRPGADRGHAQRGRRQARHLGVRHQERRLAS